MGVGTAQVLQQRVLENAAAAPRFSAALLAAEQRFRAVISNSDATRRSLSLCVSLSLSVTHTHTHTHTLTYPLTHSLTHSLSLSLIATRSEAEVNVALENLKKVRTAMSAETHKEPQGDTERHSGSTEQSQVPAGADAAAELQEQLLDDLLDELDAEEERQAKIAAAVASAGADEDVQDSLLDGLLDEL